MEGNRNSRVGRQTENQFFALLRSGLWNEVPERDCFVEGTDWEALYRLSFEQTVVPLVTDGINRLPKEFLPAEPERLDPGHSDFAVLQFRSSMEYDGSCRFRFIKTGNDFAFFITAWISGRCHDDTNSGLR